MCQVVKRSIDLPSSCSIVVHHHSVISHESFQLFSFHLHLFLHVQLVLEPLEGPFSLVAVKVSILSHVKESLCATCT